MISIICPVTNNEILKMLLNSIKKQDYTNYELIILDSKELNFKSASQTLNYGVSKASGDILLFCHQDIEFLKTNALSKIVEYSSKYDFGIAGVAGRKASDDGCFTSVIMGKDRIAGGKYYLNEIVETDTLDECMFIIKKNKFNGFEDLGDTWHFYSVEYSLRCKKNRQKVLLFPIHIYHLSPGYSLNYNYYDTLYKVGKKYKKDFNIIASPCCYVKNDAFLYFRCLYKKMKLFLKKILKIGVNNK